MKRTRWSWGSTDDTRVQVVLPGSLPCGLGIGDVLTLTEIWHVEYSQTLILGCGLGTFSDKGTRGLVVSRSMFAVKNRAVGEG